MKLILHSLRNFTASWLPILLFLRSWEKCTQFPSDILSPLFLIGPGERSPLSSGRPCLTSADILVTRPHLLDSPLFECKEDPYTLSLAVSDYNCHLSPQSRLAGGGKGPQLGRLVGLRLLQGFISKVISSHCALVTFQGNCEERGIGHWPNTLGGRCHWLLWPSIDWD